MKKRSELRLYSPEWHHLEMGGPSEKILFSKEVRDFLKNLQLQAIAEGFPADDVSDLCKRVLHASECEGVPPDGESCITFKKGGDCYISLESVVAYMNCEIEALLERDVDLGIEKSDLPV